MLLPGYDAVLDAPLGWQVTLAGLRLVPGVWQMARLMEGRLPDAPVSRCQSTRSTVRISIGATVAPSGLYGGDWGDNDLRFALLGAVAAYLALPATGLRWTPDMCI